jgi:hypothetical protein
MWAAVLFMIVQRIFVNSLIGMKNTKFTETDEDFHATKPKLITIDKI